MNIKTIEKFCPKCKDIKVVYLKTSTTFETLKQSFKIEHIDLATSVVRVNSECVDCI